MTVMVFLIDNSASMNQRTYLGTSLLDIAKGCVEEIYKIRLKFSRSDRYFIFSLDKDPNNLKSNEWKQNLHSIRTTLDIIKPNGYTSLGVGIRRTFDMLNLTRMNNGFENYGMGRYPSQIEHAIVICITDGGKLTSDSGIINGDLNLPVLTPSIPGHEYTAEPFRWDYRLYSIVLRFPGYSIEQNEIPKFIPTDQDCPISSMCEVTGGRAYKITNERMLHQCLESLSQKCHPGVVLHFMKLDESNDILKNDSQKWHNCKKMIYVKSSNVGSANSHWPIPESFWPDEHLNDKLPPRSAHPIICFSTTKMQIPKIMEHFPVDRYELEPSPLTQYILERRDTNFVWHCYVPKSGKTQDYPFGYLKPSSDLLTVHLYVLSYNFPALIDLLSNLSDTLKMRINDVWGSKFAHYLGIIPKYYFSPLSRAFEKIGLPYLIKHESIERILPFNLKSNLQKLRQMAKMQFEMDQRASANVEQKASLSRGSNLLKWNCVQGNNNHNNNNNSTNTGGDIIGGAASDLISIQLVSAAKIPRIDMNSYFLPNKIDRIHLRSMVKKNVANFKEFIINNNRLMDHESIHEQRMAEMGDYSNYKYSKLPEPLKEIHPAPERKETFGNPFRRKSSSNAFEADEKFVEDMITNSDGAKLSRRPSNSEMGRTKGPLPLSVTYFNWRTPTNSVCSTPISSPTRSEISDYPETYDMTSTLTMTAGGPMTTVTRTPATAAAASTTGKNGIKEILINTILMKDSNVDEMYTNNNNSTGSSTNSTIATTIVKDNYFHNKALVKKLITILRHPKIDGKEVFKLLTKFKGPYKLQTIMISRCLQQAVQFKRHKIALLVQQYLVNLKSQFVVHKNNLVNGHGK